MSKLIDRTGETLTMNSSGLKATITAYKTAKDIDITFENGAVVECIEYYNFRRGMIRCPMMHKQIDDYIVWINPNTDPITEFLTYISDFDIVDGNHWHITRSGYISRSNKSLMLHRIIMNARDGCFVDHINHDKTDNRRINLRICSQVENLQNMKIPKHNTSGYKGVSWNAHANSWSARIRSNSRNIHLGYFKDKLEAAKAYDMAAIEHFGEFALVNGVIE